MIRNSLLFFVLLSISSACQPYNNQEINNNITAFSTETKHTYKNPVVNSDFPDPVLFKASNGLFYAYATQTPNKNIQAVKSKDMINWQTLDDVLPVKPKWANNTQNFWAPHVLEDNNKFYMYFAAEIKDKGLALGVATSDSPEGPFTDSGQPLVSGEGFVNIDAMAFDDPVSKKKYMYWGSGFQPIKVQELSADRLHFAANSKPQNIINPSKFPYENLVEGAWVTYKNGYYYMFYSGDNCCENDPHYAVMVARAKSPTGPFTKLADATGKADSVILEKNDKWTGVGHNAVFTDSKGQDWIIYHGIDRSNMYITGTKSVRRPMLIDKLNYKNGWPYIKNNSPSSEESEAPAL
ncbi:MAG: family 43 glycosylhydrolase [Candidatus Sericytochromatia bacterium]|nr:family 43 glycosylhydrolase [Candidatus Sericytochromatia bacterium]